MYQPQFSYSSFVDLLRDRAQTAPDRLCHTFLADGENESGRYTFAQLDLQARAIAAQLQNVSQLGDRALVVFPYTAGLEFIAAFLGCLYAGVIAVTDNPPRKVEGIVKSGDRALTSGARLGLTTQTLLKQIQPHLDQPLEAASPLSQLQWIATDTIDLALASHWQRPNLTPETLAYFQHTSGSTGKPKGVMVSHGNMLYNSEVIRQSFEHTADSRVLLWLPLYHDMGLIGGVMQPLYASFHMVLMSPISLIQKPWRWLEGISCYRINTSGGPNFAYDLLCQQVTPQAIAQLDLHHWDLAFSGAEPVRAETLERFASLFAPAGFSKEAFYPCYGMAESTLFITGGQKRQAPRILALDSKALERNEVLPAQTQAQNRQMVSCGVSWLKDEVAIVDPESRQRLGENQVGEIWARGPGIAKGYWQQPEESEFTFGARLAETGDGPFLRTGDLGFIQAGELYITGRMKDLMILWGRNHYPQHIEATMAQAHSALRVNCGAAFSIEAAGEERLVVVQEVQRPFLRQLPTAEIIQAIRMKIAEEHIAEVYAVALLKTGSIPKTSSGKIQRRLCRSMFLKGRLSLVGQWRQEHATSSSVNEMIERSAISL